MTDLVKFVLSLSGPQLVIGIGLILLLIPVAVSISVKSTKLRKSYIILYYAPGLLLLIIGFLMNFVLPLLDDSQTTTQTIVTVQPPTSTNITNISTVVNTSVETKKVISTTTSESNSEEKKLTLFKSLINQGVNSNSTKPNIAIIIEAKPTESGINPEKVLYNLIKSEQVNIVFNIFKEELFKSSGFFSEMYNGNTEILKKANALQNVDNLILGKLIYSFQKRIEFDQEIISCSINFSYKVIDKNSSIVRVDNINISGPGFSEDKALERGLEMLAKNHSERILKP